MRKITILENILFGKHDRFDDPKRSCTIFFPAKEDGDVSRTIKFAGDDGLILTLIKRIEKLEAKKAKKK